MSRKTTDLVITPKRLGLIQLDDFCPRCYWHLLKLKFHPPFDHFGGAIFKHMEQAQMAVIGKLLEQGRALPSEFEPFCDIVERVDFPRSWRKFQHRLDSGVLLYGEPDEVFRLSDDSIAIVDHKTANPKNGKDPFQDCYHVQCLGYGLIAEFGLGLGKVSKAGLIYWAIEHERVVEAPASHYKNDRLIVSFVPKPVAFEIDYHYLDSPLKEAIHLWEANSPPDGESKCKDCAKLDALFALNSEAESFVLTRNRWILRASGNDRWTANKINQAYFEAACRRNSALAHLRDESDSDDFSDDGMISNWLAG